MYTKEMYDATWLDRYLAGLGVRERQQVLQRVRVDPVGFVEDLWDAKHGPRGF